MNEAEKVARYEMALEAICNLYLKGSNISTYALYSIAATALKEKK